MTLRLRRGPWIMIALATLAVPARAQLATTQPPALAEVGVTERLGARLPLDLELVGENGAPVRLGELVGPGPTILTLNYYRCPMLCGLQLNGLLEGLRALPWEVGDRFRVVTVSIDPTEGPELARAKKASYLKAYGRPGAGDGWRFLTGEPEAIRRLAEAVGFHYRWDAETGQFAHPAVATVIAPDGTIVRYLYGIEYPPRQLRLALTEAGEGTIGSPFDRLILTCYCYDPSSRRYAPVAMRIMRLGGAATVAVLGLVLGTLWVRERRRRSG